MSQFALLLLVTTYFALACSHIVRALRRFYDNRVHGGLLIAMLIIPYILTALPTANTRPTAFADGLARMLAYLCWPGWRMAGPGARAARSLPRPSRTRWSISSGASSLETEDSKLDLLERV